MRIGILLKFSCCLLVYTAFAQTATSVSSAVVPNLPTTLICAGASYNTNVKPSLAAGFTSISLQVGSSTSRTYSISTLDFTATTSSMRTGVAYAIVQLHGVTLLAHTDGGVTTSSYAALGSFSGGGILTYNLGHKFKVLEKIYVFGVVRILVVSSTAARPVYELGIGFAK